MAFDPNNKIIQLCLQGMDREGTGKPEEARRFFLQAWDEATDDFERYTAAYFVARQQQYAADKVKWYETAVQYALRSDRNAVRGVLSSLYSLIAECYHDLGDTDNARKYELSARTHEETVPDDGPFYHGTKADLKVGDLLTAGGRSNYTPGLTMNHVYFTALVNGAGLAAALAKGDGSERIYVVEPTGRFENDPNVTDKKFPGNPTRSYRTRDPLRIVGEVTDWIQRTPEELRQWREKLANAKGDIIN